ncbi:MAG: endonuclease MutS2 [Thermoanaerobacteraceae bacterium]|nr:endonuclease MutS2 [Thermoanaerobacteraceae bacterium]
MKCKISERDLKALEYNKVVDMLKELTFTPMGFELADGLMPGYEMDIIRIKLNETGEALKMIGMKGFPSIGRIKDIRRILNSLRIGADLNQGEFLDIAGVLNACSILRDYVLDDEIGCELLTGLAGKIKPHRELQKEIDAKIISEEEMDDNASPELYSIRRKIKNLNTSIRERLNSMITSPQYQKILQDPIITIREGRFVIPVKQEFKGAISGIIHDQSASGATLYMEPMPIVEMNNEIRQLELKERDEIQRILKELSEKVREVRGDIEDDIDILGELDFIFARAYLAQKMNAIKPELNDSGVFRLLKARHPLISPENVVPIDIEVGKDFDILVITGPNTGGKTVSLKTAGLLEIMALSGLYIPAAPGSEVAVFDNIFADIGDEQSIEQSLSTFSSHISNIVRIINNVNRNSLVLLDELGAGTDPTEGAALGLGILEFFREHGIKVIATTHYSEVKAYALKTEGVENASVEFDVNTLRPTYRLMIGIPGKSNAFLISERLGLDRNIIERAREYISSEEIKMEDLIIELERDRIKAEEDKRRAEILSREIEVTKSEIEEEKKRLEMERAEILKEARDRANRLISETKKEANRIIKEIRELNKIEDRSNRDREIERLRKEIAEKLGTDEEEEIGTRSVPENLAPGMDVYIKSIGQNGIVLRTDEDKVEVQVGIIKITVDRVDLLESETKKKKTVQRQTELKLSKVSTISPQIDVRGMNLDDALIAIDKYLDDAYLAGLKQVTIIHGKGTGVLRNGVKEFLKGNRRVSSFRLGMLSEGGDGVTVVEL